MAKDPIKDSSRIYVNKLVVVVIGALAFLLGIILTRIGPDLQKYGPFYIALHSSIIKCNHSRGLNLNVSEIKIHFFDFVSNYTESYPINTAAQDIPKVHGFDKTRKVVVFVGGFTSHINHTIEKQMKEAYGTHPHTYLIIPDHSPYTNNEDGNIKSYTRSVTYVHYIGKSLGEMLAKLKNEGLSPKNIHCVGHSLGGQILGHTGSTFYNITGEKIARITALDPAGPCFTFSAVDNQVRSGLADYVEVFHCNSGALGSSSILGDVDFIVNRKGEMQPNCGTPIVPLVYTSSKAASCNHRACVDLWTAAVRNPSIFWAYSCDSYKNFKAGKCLNNDRTLVGPESAPKAFGEYYLSTEKIDLNKLK